MLYSQFPVLFAWAPGPWELGVVALLALLFFGNRLPGMMRSLGSGVNEFKKGMREGEKDDEDGEDEKPPKKSE
jgi:sec-independent protein translocase protein TatA